jgi:hypothetical protein
MRKVDLAASQHLVWDEIIFMTTGSGESKRRRSSWKGRHYSFEWEPAPPLSSAATILHLGLLALHFCMYVED